MIACDLALALDGAAFARAAGLATPDPWQVQLLRSQARQIMLNCSRQAGKSIVSSLLALHTALYQPEAVVLLLAPALRQSQELFRKVRAAYDVLTYRAAEIVEESALRVEFTNDSRIVCLPGKEQTIRGFSGVSLLVCDEAAYTPDELYRAVRPMLAVSGGRIVLLSTPFGRRGFFWQAWADGGPNWQRFEVPAIDVPRIPAAFLEEERRALGLWYAQEYECQFLDTMNQVFASDDIRRAISSDIQPLFGVSA